MALPGFHPDLVSAAQPKGEHGQYGAGLLVYYIYCISRAGKEESGRRRDGARDAGRKREEGPVALRMRPGAAGATAHQSAAAASFPWTRDQQLIPVGAHGA